MGIYIPNMEMPKEGDFIVIRHEGQAYYVSANPQNAYEREAIPVPPHGRLIDADALTKQIKRDGIASDPFVKIVCDYFKEAPTIIPAQTEKEGQ